MDIPKTSFGRGELDPEWQGRADLGIYGQGVDTMLNWICTMKGSAIPRPGTVFVAEAIDHDSPTELIDFVYGDDQEYVLAVNSNGLRVHKDQGTVLSGEDPVEVAMPASWASADVLDVDYDQDGLEMRLTHKSGDVNPLTLARGENHTTWTLEDTVFSSKPAEWTGENWPKYVKYFEGRAAFAATPAEPMQCWLSQSADTDNMSGGSGDTAAMDFPIKAKGSITCLAEGDLLVLGTSKGMRTIGNRNDILTPTANTQKKRTESHIAPVRPLQIGIETLFVGHERDAIYRFAYEFASDNFVDEDIAEASRHLLAAGIRKMAFCPNPIPIAWCLLNDGSLVSVTYGPRLQVIGMARHQIAGVDDESGSDHGFVESICSIAGARHSELWLSVRRTINGQTRRYIEFMAEPFNATKMAREDAVLVDCAIVYDGDTAINGFTGADHLEGQTLAVMKDGATTPAVDVSGGAFALNAGAKGKKVIAGLGYDKVLIPLTPVIQTQAGSSFGKEIVSVRYKVDVLNTGGLRIGDDPAIKRRDGQAMDAPVPLYTGFIDKAVEGSWKAKKQPKIWQKWDEPQPATIRVMVGVYDTSGAR